eukprot:m.1182685 g.1182685  ORF g.1182685 m.1182685 type:complete len:402 (+) comp24538_c0_seq4:246-1451(+)
MSDNHSANSTLRRRRINSQTTKESSDQNASVADIELPPQKSLLIAYLLYFCGGFCGLHHLYLGRDNHAILWCTTFGGLIAGVVRDFWRLPEYVKEANRDAFLLERHGINQRENTRPSSWAMLFALFQLPRIYRQVVLNLYPRNDEEGTVDPWFVAWTLTCGSLAVAWAITWVSKMSFCWNSSFKWALLGATIGELINVWKYLSVSDGTAPVERDLVDGTYCILVAIFAAYRSRSYVPVEEHYAQRKKQRQTQSLCRRITKVIACVGIFYLLLGTAVYQNGVITTEDNSQVRIRDRVKQILNSPAWAQLQTECGIAANVWMSQGYDEFRRHVMNRLDINGEQRALVDLGLSDNATTSEIRASANALRKLYHPDRCTLPADECVRKFQSVQHAFEVLTRKPRE